MRYKQNETGSSGRETVRLGAGHATEPKRWIKKGEWTEGAPEVPDAGNGSKGNWRVDP